MALLAAPLVAVLLAAGASCTGSSGADEPGGTPVGSGENEPSPSAVPGRYRTLPEPCSAVPQKVLDRVLPGGRSGSPSLDDFQKGEDGGNGEASGTSGGKALLTYDTDRRVGCEWSGENGTRNRRIRVDFERVVSYDPAVSDEEQAQEEYLAAAGNADVPTGGRSSVPSTGGGRSPVSGAPPSGTASPRQVPGIGDEAFLEDRLRADAAEPHREITMVFRKENVIVQVTLREWPLESGRMPSGSAMQTDTHLLARELAKQLGEE